MKGTAAVSLTKRQLEAQHDWHAEPVGTDIQETLSDLSYVSRILHQIESGMELSAETLCDLCVCLSNAERRLMAMNGEGRAH
jgi:hypothetical protein